MAIPSIKKPIAVALSGGVDSSVSAYLLQKQGYLVHGVFITIRSPSHVSCTSAIDKQYAMRACAHLRIPFVSFDATSIYADKVIEPVVAAYRAGKTPNPDVLCNTFVKFGAFYSFLQEKGYSHIATGHYAQVRTIANTSRLYRSKDEAKDQTYFIYTLAEDILKSLHFPIGGYTKSKVRDIAATAGLPSAERKDSVGLCFISASSMKDFLSAYLPVQEGEVQLATRKGECIGFHDGACFYTIGQRHGFTVTVSKRGPYVVVAKDVSKNILYVMEKSISVGSTSFTIIDTVFRRIPDEPLFARYRHRGELFPVTISNNNGTYTVNFENNHLIASGQSVVVYTADGECIGGGHVS